MGRKLLRSLGQRLGFFMTGDIRPILSLEGNTPVDTDKLYKEAIGTARTSMAVFRREVGIGSSEHDLVGHNLTISITSLCETWGNSRRESLSGTAISATSSSSLAPDSRDSSSARSLVGLSAKKAMKSSASCCNESCSGSFLAGFTRSRSPTARNSFLWSAPQSSIILLSCLVLASSHNNVRRSRASRSSCLSISNLRLIHLLSTARARLLASSTNSVLQKFSGRMVITFFFKGACFSSKDASPWSYCSINSLTSSAGFCISGSSNRSLLKAAVSIFLIDLNMMLFLDRTGRWARTSTTMARWSLKIPLTLQLEIGLSVTREKMRSSVCPSVWVGPFTCWRQPNDLRSDENRAGTFLSTSTWTLKLPISRVFLVEDARRSRSEVNSVRNRLMQFSGGR